MQGQRAFAAFAAIPCFWSVLCAQAALPAQEIIAVESGHAMKYLAPANDPGLGVTWTAMTFGDGAWTAGTYGVGYDTDGNASALIQTPVPDGRHTVYTRVHFSIPDVAAITSVHFGADFDDGHVAWLNGVEIVRDNMPDGTPGFATNASGTREPSNGSPPSYDPIRDVSTAALPALLAGDNVLAVGIWNANSTSSDLVLVPFLSFNRPPPPTGTPLCGTLSGTTTLTKALSPYTVTCNVTVPRGSTLRIESGVEVLVGGGFGISVAGQIFADGTELEPIQVTGNGARWSGIDIDHSSDGTVRASTLQHVELSYGTTLLDVAGTGTSPIRVDHCVFDRWSSLAVHWDGAHGLVLSHCELGMNTPLSEANHETINGYRAGAVVEYCTFGRRRDYNDVIDLGDTSWGEPVPTVRYNVFTGGDDDAIDFDGSAGWIIGNLVMEHYPRPGSSSSANGGGITGNDGSETVVMNNIVYRCYHGIGYKNGCQPLIVNNLVLDCNIGVTFYQDDCARGRPSATLYNNIVWNNRSWTTGADQNVVLNGRWFPDYCQDAGDQATAVLNHCIVEGGWAGTGNRNLDPKIVDPAGGDFSLSPDSPAIDAGFGGPLAKTGVSAALLAAAFGIDWAQLPRVDMPCIANDGSGTATYVDLGALELQLPGPCGGEPSFVRGDSNGDAGVDIADGVHILLVLFGGRTGNCADARDVDDDGNVNVTDPIVLLTYLFRNGPELSAPFPSAGADPTADALGCQRF